MKRTIYIVRGSEDGFLGAFGSATNAVAIAGDYVSHTKAVTKTPTDNYRCTLFSPKGAPGSFVDSEQTGGGLCSHIRFYARKWVGIAAIVGCKGEFGAEAEIRVAEVE